MATLDGLFYQATDLREHETAVIYDDGRSELSSLTYGQLKQKAHTIRDVLRNRGLLEEVVGVLVRPSTVLPAVLIGMMSAPAAFMSLDTIAQKGTLQKTLARLNIRSIIISGDKLEGLKMRFPDVCLRTEDLGLDLALVWVGETTTCATRWDKPLAYVITTSGSTGEPKIIKVPHSCILPNVTHISSLYEMRAGDVSILMSPLTFDPSIVEMFIALSSGAKLLLVPELVKMRPCELLSVLQRHSVSVMQTTPTLFARFAKEGLMGRLLAADSSLRVVALGGEPCPPLPTILTWPSQGNKTRFINLYGVTEVSSWATYYLIPDQNTSDEEEVPLGIPLNGTEVKVRDCTGQKIAEGEGQLFAGSKERVCLVEDETGPTCDGLRPTGDLVLITSSGGLYYRGRLDRQIKRSGKRLNLDTLELVVSREASVVTSAAVTGGEGELHLFVQVKQGVEEMEVFTAKLRRDIRHNLPSQYMPDRISVLTDIPYTRHGKVDRERLLAFSCTGNPSDGLKSTKDLEEVLRSSWKACLPDGERAEVSEASNWLRSGGDSFSAVHLLTSLTDSLDLHPPTLLDLILTGSFSDILHLLRQSREELITLPHDIHGSSLPMLSLDRTQTEGNVLKQTSEKDLKRTHSGDGEEEDALSVKRPFMEARVKDKDNVDRCQSADSTLQNICSCERRFLALSRCNRSVSCCEQNQASHSSSQTLKKERLDETERSQLRLNLRRLWSVSTGKCIDASPLVLIRRSCKLVFIGSHSHRFLAICAESGEVRWEQVLGDRIESSACLSPCGRYVVVGCYDGVVYFMAVESGEIVWSFATQGQVKCSPAPDPHTGLIYVGSHDQRLYALNAQEKSCAWRVDLAAGSIYSSPVVCPRQHVVYCATLGGLLFAVDSCGGRVLWRQSVGKPLFSSPSLIPGGVAVGCVDRKMYAFTQQGEQMWTFEASGPVFSSPSFSGWTFHESQDCLLFGCHGNAIFCVNKRGKMLWKYQTPSPVFTSPFIVDIDSLVVCCDTGGHLVVLDLKDGRCVGSHELPGEVFSSPVVYKDRVYIGCRDDYLYCLELRRTLSEPEKKL